MKFHHATPIVCPVPVARKSRRSLFALAIGLFSLLTPTALRAAVYDFSPIDGGSIMASPSANGVLLSVNGNNPLNVPSGVPNFIRNHNGVVAWSVNGTVYSYVFDPGRSNWVGTSSSHGVTISDLNSTDGVVAWSVENALQGSAHYRVYDPARGAWVSQSGPGPIEENRILNTNGVVAWSVGSTAYGRVYDPTRNGGEWRPFAAALTGPTSDLITSDGVVAWSSLNVTATIGFRVYDPGRGEWQGNTANANSVTSLRITNSQVSWKMPTFVTRGYDPVTAMWGTAPVPLAYFAVSTNAGNAPFVVSFVDMSIGANSWSWSFGDGPGSSLKRSPGYRYTTFGRFTAAQNASRPGASLSTTTRTILTDITLPVGTNRINSGATFTTNPVVTLSPSATDNSGVVTDMRFSNTNNANWSNWEPLASTKTWTLSAGNGIKTVYAQFRDIAVNTSATFSATIALDTTAPPIVSFVNVAVSEAAGLATVQVTLDHSLGRNLSIRYSTSDGTATAPGDYTATSAVLVFPSNTTSRTFTVPIAVDSLVEPNETIQLLFSDPTNCVPGLPGTITILDNDVASVGFAATNFNVVESNGVANVVVRLNAVSGQPISVEYQITNGTATAGADFTATNGTLFFAPGQAEQAIPVSIVSDSDSEFSETILVSLSNPTNATLMAPIAATVTIQDDDLPLLYFPKATYPVVEGAGALMVEVQLSKPFPQEVAFNYSVFGGTATPGGSGDYLASNGRLSIAPNTTNQFFFVNLVDNAVVESDETVRMTLSGITGAMAGPRLEADVLIVDDDGPPAFVAPRVTTNGQFKVTLSGAPGQVFRLHYSTNLPHWLVEASLTNTASGALEYSIPVSSGPQRFYRTSVP